MRNRIVTIVIAIATAILSIIGTNKYDRYVKEARHEVQTFQTTQR